MLHIPQIATAEILAVRPSASPEATYPTDVRTLIKLHRYADEAATSAKTDAEMERHNKGAHQIYRALIATTPSSVQEEAERLSYILTYLRALCGTDGQLDGGWLDVPELTHIAKNLARLAAPVGPGALKVINKNVQSMNRSPEPSLQAELDRLECDNDVEGMIALYDYFVALTDANSAISNMPRGSAVDDFLDAECNRFWSKAYAVADRLKRLKPTAGQREYHARTLIDAAFALGGTLKDVAAITRHLNEASE